MIHHSDELTISFLCHQDTAERQFFISYRTVILSGHWICCGVVLLSSQNSGSSQFTVYVMREKFEVYWIQVWEFASVHNSQWIFSMWTVSFTHIRVKTLCRVLHNSQPDISVQRKKNKIYKGRKSLLLFLFCFRYTFSIWKKKKNLQRSFVFQLFLRS